VGGNSRNIVLSTGLRQIYQESIFPMNYYRYGQEEKKITFADTDKRHAELRIKLRRDGLSQVDFFKSMVSGYIDNDPNILMYITKIKQEKSKIGKRKIIKQNEDIKQGNQTLQDLGITSQDIDFVFDLIERGDDEV